jgi:hypothetical protein
MAKQTGSRENAAKGAFSALGGWIILGSIDNTCAFLLGNRRRIVGVFGYGRVNACGRRSWTNGVL